jgi:hypothetical protein
MDIMESGKVGTKDVWGEGTNSFIIEEDDLGCSAKSLFNLDGDNDLLCK